MANKRNREIWEREEKQRKYNAAFSGIGVFPILALCVSVVTILLYFITFAGVYNSSGNSYEPPKFSGFNLIFALLSDGWTKTEGFGGIWIYYHFVQDQTTLMGVLALIAIIAEVANIILSIVTLATKKHFLNAVSIALGAVAAISLLVCFIIAVGVGQPLMKGYQCNLKVCSHRSYIILPCIVALVGLIPSVLALKKYSDAKKLLK